MTLLERITYQHSETARQVWKRTGRLFPKIWAQSVDQMIVASPLDGKASDATTDEFRATLAVAMACRIDALAIGRSDEAYIRTASEAALIAGDLNRIADIDPEVRTCVITEAVALGGSEEFTLVAIHHLDDSGRSDWEVRESHNSSRTTLVPLQAARNLIDGGLPDFWRDPNALEQFAGQIRWELSIFPEPTR